MLTRLRVQGFKNLDFDARFGPFTCIAGPPDVGKSNLFEAISFLGALAERPLLEAARGLRGAEQDLRDLFFLGEPEEPSKMLLLAEMIVPEWGEDDLGQGVRASMTYLSYHLELAYLPAPELRPRGRVQIIREELHHLKQGEARQSLAFPHKKLWRESVVRGRRAAPFISTEAGRVRLHADSQGQGGGAVRSFQALSLPRTLLSTASNSLGHRTSILARAEMRSWIYAQPEAAELREPKFFEKLKEHASSLICLDEPRQGIHPDDSPRLLKRLKALLLNANWPQPPGEPMRQLIINTHSPGILSLLYDDSLLLASLNQGRMSLRPLEGTWRCQAGEDCCDLEEVLDALSLPLERLGLNLEEHHMMLRDGFQLGLF